MRLLITGGGTGGHVYPALSVLEAWTPAPDLLWVGTKGGMEAALVERAGIPYRGIPAGGLRDMGLVTRLRNSVKLTRGFGEAWTIVREFRPDVVFATGGYVTFPVGMAAWLQRIPVAIYLPDITPGLAVRSLAPLAKRIAVTTPGSARWFGPKAVVTGYPVRQTLAQPRSKARARASFDIPADAKVLLVTGGSSGSHNLNEAVGSHIAEYLSFAHVIHVHGKVDKEWLNQQRAALPEETRERYHLYEYLHETMTDALMGADLVVARAGASVLGEFTAAALPAILVPLPIVGVNQHANAQWLEDYGGAVTLADEEAMTGLLPLARSILKDEARLERMREAMRAAALPDAANRIAEMLQGLAPQRVLSHEADKSYE